MSNGSITERLNTALAGRYRIERHLGAGGIENVEYWDLHPDGKRVIVTIEDTRLRSGGTTAAGQPASRYLVVQGWFSHLERLTHKEKQ